MRWKIKKCFLVCPSCGSYFLNVALLLTDRQSSNWGKVAFALLSYSTDFSSFGHATAASAEAAGLGGPPFVSCHCCCCFCCCWCLFTGWESQRNVTYTLTFSVVDRSKKITRARRTSALESFSLKSFSPVLLLLLQYFLWLPTAFWNTAWANVCICNANQCLTGTSRDLPFDSFNTRSQSSGTEEKEEKYAFATSASATTESSGRAAVSEFDGRKEKELLWDF